MRPHRARPPFGLLTRAVLSRVAVILGSFGLLTLQAGDILRGGASRNAPTAPGNSANTSAAADAARANAKDALARTTQALQAVQNMQAAARAAAKSGPNNLGANPNAPTFQLPDVPDGIGPGGLEVHPNVATDPTLWTGANKPTQSGNTVNITQTSQQAVLNWKTFNVGKNTTVNFDQTAGGSNVGTWIAFNKITDPSGAPSQILGSINATGQVYVINQNGIIFGGSSQVNTHTLVASSLPINDNLLSRGILNNPDAQFLFSALPQAGGSKGPTSTFTPPAAPASGVYGDVTVQSGAQLSAPTSAEHVGGRVALVGANVRNAGTISTPDGQTILAAGLQVGFDSHKSSDPSLRGLDVYVGAIASPSSSVAPYAGTASNSGLIDVPRGNATLTGKTVNQLGAINSSTSVSLNGRIDLLANYGALPNQSYDPVNSPDLAPFLYFSSGNVTLGQGSSMAILPELSSSEKVVGTQLALRSQVNIQGKTIYLAPQSTILAPNAVVNVSAGVWDYVQQNATLATSTFVNSGGQVYLDSKAMINVAGSTDVAAPLFEYIINVTLRGSELADSPLQRTSIFRPGDGTNPTITVDLRKTGTYNGRTWYGTPLADLSGYLGLIQRNVGELTVAGGTVNIHAGGSLVVQSGAVVDVSGGFVNYGGGTVKTTRVLYAGHIFDIADATPDRLYEGIYKAQFTENHPRWGISKTYNQPLALLGEHYEQPYISGANGGTLDLMAPGVALDGEFFGHTIVGPKQLDNLPTLSTLSIALQTQFQITPYPKYSPKAPDVTIADTKQAPADPFALDESGNPLTLRDDRLSTVVLSPSLINDRGFGNFSLENSEGNITVPLQTKINAPVKGSITMNGANLDIQGSITAPSGSVKLTVFNISPFFAFQHKADPAFEGTQPNIDRGNFILGSVASLSTAGLIIDDRLSSPTSGSSPLITTGGTVSINTYNAELAAGSLIDVSGGVRVAPTGKISYGDAGSISIKAGQDPGLVSVLGGKLNLEATLKGFSGAKAGALTLQAPIIQIGGQTTNVNALLLKPDFFDKGGFGSFNLIGLGEATGNADEMTPGVTVAPGTTIDPKALSSLAIPNVLGDNSIAIIPILKEEGLRTPVSISLSTPGVISDFTGLLTTRGDLVIGSGSKIITDALGSVSLSGNTVSVFGTITAPGGKISVTGSSNSIATFLNRTNAQTEALATVYLAPGSSLSTVGKALFQLDRWGHRIGSVLPGGTITVTGNILADAGSKLDVSGASGVLDVFPTSLDLAVIGNAPLVGSPLVPVTSGVTSPLYNAASVAIRQDSNAGTITLKGGQELYTAASLVGKAGGPTALGGNLIISSGTFYPATSQPQDKKPTDVTLRVTQSNPGFSAGYGGVGIAVKDSSGSPLSGQGQFAIDYFKNGGFEALQLGGTIDFVGQVNINAKRSLVIGVPSSSSSIDGGVITANADVMLTAPYIAIGKPFKSPLQSLELQNSAPYVDGFNSAYHFSPSYGSGKITLKADLIDVGNLSLQNIGEANFIADNGDIRGQGTLDVAGNIYLRAGQIYPVTASPFTIAAYDYSIGGKTLPGTVTIEGSGVRKLPLSAGGTLSIYGSVINQSGTVRAPIGTINIGWDGTGTAPKDLITGVSIPVTQKLTLATGSVTSVSAYDPSIGEGIVIPYGVNPNGTAWIDPTGLDITAGGAPAKTVNISAQNLSTQAGSLIDIRGGGDLYAYRWVKGNGGSQDVLTSTGSYAVIPGYDSNFAPFAPFSTSSTGSVNLNGDTGYVSNNLSLGDRVYLNGTTGLSSGYYTLLPARYALLPGAFLVTPQLGTAIGTFNTPEGSTLVNGYRYNELNASRTVPEIYSRFEVASSAIVRKRSEYVDYFANTFLRDSALKLDQKVPRLPIDAGYLLLSASQSAVVQGNVNARGATGGRGGLVDISSSQDIFITAAGATAPAGTLALDSALLSSYGADSLLIGGSRTFGTSGTTVNVRTNNVTVNNAGSPLIGPEIVLVANQKLTVAPGASIQQTGTLSDSADLLLLGDSSIPGSGNGTLLRVTSDPTAQIVRSGVSFASGPSMIIGILGVPGQEPVHITGLGVTLDSTYATWLDPSAIVSGQAVNLNSGQVSLQLNSAVPVTQNSIGGLVLSGTALQTLQSTQSLSLLSYSAIDIYGDGAFTTSGSLALHGAEIRGFNSGGTARFAAQNIQLDNSPGRPVSGIVQASSGTLVFDAATITVGEGQLSIDQFSNVILNASSGILMQGSGGLAVQGALTANTPEITASKGAKQSLTASGDLNLVKTSGGSTSVAGGLGAALNIVGSNVNVGSNVLLESGVLNIRAQTGALTISGILDVSGTEQTFFDQVRYTDGGQITLGSDTSDINVNSGSLLNVSAQSGGGKAGSIFISSPNGMFNLAGAMNGVGGSGGTNGTFYLDVLSLNQSEYGTINTTLEAASFTESRNIRVRTGDVTLTGVTKAKNFALSADQGSIILSNTIDSSGTIGGTIRLAAWKNIILQSGSFINVAAQNFNNAGKGGAVYLEAGSAVFNSGTYAGSSGAVLDIQSGSKIDLSVAANTSSSAEFGKFTGTLHLRAPQNVAGNNLGVNPINGTIIGGSAITVEGYKIFTPAGGNITTAIQNSIKTSLTTFGNASSGLTNTLLAGNVDKAALTPITVVMPGAEVINRTGDLTLGTTSSTATTDWNLGAVRFGSSGTPGVLTLKAAGNIVLFNAISDGFDTSAYNSQLLPINPSLPTNVQSWSYRMASGADFKAADFHNVQSISSLDTSFPAKGSLLLGKNGGLNISSTTGTNATTASAVNSGTGRFQVIRTGTGDIDIVAGRDVQLLNQFASIYTVGVQVSDPSMGGTFDTPTPSMAFTPLGNLGGVQQSSAYPAQYTMAGGNVSVKAGADILHQTRNSSNVLIPDSERELPNNWLDRRGYIDPATGLFGVSHFGEIASTSWWIDFSNFFEGVGALGGGNLALIAGNNITNVDGLVPTNARMAGKSAGLAIAPNAANLLELGGGDLEVKAGGNIDGGVYYVERGIGNLSAGGNITTNATRSPSLGILKTPASILTAETWLPTTLYLGKGGFNVNARGNVLVGPTVNTFLLPQGYNNSYWYKTWFSTYDSSGYVNVSSLGGYITFRESVTLPSPGGTGVATPVLLAFIQRENLWNTQVTTGGAQTASAFQPWLRLTEDDVSGFDTVATLMPSTLRATAFSGDINLVGSINLSPSPTGTLDILASGAFNALQISGQSTINDVPVSVWTSAKINLSDASLSNIPNITSPFAYHSLVGNVGSKANSSSKSALGLKFLSQKIDNLFAETGSTSGSAGVVQTKQALHASGVLHSGDTEPLRIYAGTGDISGLTLFSGKASRIIAGHDITDISLYVQNANSTDVTVVSSGRDIVAYDANSPLRVAAQLSGNAIGDPLVTLVDGSQTNARLGDIQISGPGTLEVLAGRNFDLGAGLNSSDGTGVGLTSIGNGRNPYLPFAGADIIAGAGFGTSITSLSDSSLGLANFLTQSLNGPNGARYLSELNTVLSTSTTTSTLTVSAITALPKAQQEKLALQLFFIVLRDAGRDHNTQGAPGFGNYNEGLSAIAALFPTAGSGAGEITTQGRDVRTKSGGNISLLAPSGGITLQTANISGLLTPPGIITESGGTISTYTNNSVDLGISRIFTLRGGDITMWSTTGNIAAGSSSKTVQSAPPTRVLVDPQSGNIQTDLAGLATGGGIGVLATVTGVAPGNVDLIAVIGTVDAGDAGIRATGNLNIAATAVLNASNISVSGSSTGTPTAPTVSAPNIGGLASASATAGASTSSADMAAKEQAKNQASTTKEELPSIIVVDVLGYGAGEEGQ